jgi:hypothetical protein
MTLAVILVSISLTASVAHFPAAPLDQDAAQTAPATKPPTNTPDQGSTGQNPQARSNPPSPTTGSAAAKPNPSLPKRPLKHPLRLKKQVRPCDEPSPAASTPDATLPGSVAPAPGPTNPSSGAGTSATRSANAAANCPPSKIIVRHGGTSEPPIHLSGGPEGVQAAQQRNTANQMLTATQLNLKKIAGRTLTANQQDMVKQVHQFMEQSKAAAATGDTDRARMLAWKAQLLSEELTNPLK